MKLINLFCTVFIALFVIGCTSETDKLAQTVKKWEGKKIIFPQKMIFSLFALDTLDYLIPENRYKIISYVDSGGCTECKLQLYKWRELAQEMSSIQEVVPILFFFHSNDSVEISAMLQRGNFTGPVYMDKHDSLNILNEFPENEIFHTFLLNEDNEVVAMGNPIRNFSVKELYFNILSNGKLNQHEQRLSTKVLALDTTVNLGEFSSEQSQSCIFTLYNTGENMLVIDDAVTSCGCTSVEYSKEPVSPGKSLDIIVTYKADHPEHFNKTITVYCNSSASPLRLKIMGNAK